MVSEARSVRGGESPRSLAVKLTGVTANSLPSTKSAKKKRPSNKAQISPPHQAKCPPMPPKDGRFDPTSRTSIGSSWRDLVGLSEPKRTIFGPFGPPGRPRDPLPPSNYSNFPGGAPAGHGWAPRGAQPALYYGAPPGAPPGTWLPPGESAP
jgi:hypothetical protein